MSPEKWTDRALDERFRSIDQRFETIADTMEALSDMPASFASTLNRTEDRLEQRIRDISQAVKEVAQTCADFRREWRTEKEQREKADKVAREKRALTRTQGAFALAVGALGLVGVVVAALIQSGSL